MKSVVLALVLSTSAFAQSVNLKSCKVELTRFHPIACSGGGIVPLYCTGSVKALGPMQVDLSFDTATGNGSGSIYTHALKLTEGFKLSCSNSKQPGYIDCVSDLGILGVSDKKLLLRTRAQSLQDGSHFFWVGAPGDYQWLGSFQTTKACQP